MSIPDTQRERAKALAVALMSCDMTQREREEWALMTAFMNNDQIDQLIVLLNAQTAEQITELEELKQEMDEKIKQSL